MNSLKKNRILLIAEFALILLPCLAILFAGMLGLSRNMVICIGLSSLFGATADLAVLLVSRKQAQKAGQSVFNTLLLLIPSVQYAFILIMLAVFKDPELDTSSFMGILIGLIFIVSGNTLPKSEPNPVFGIRTKRTMANRENWRQTSRISGILWIIGGLLCWFGVIINAGIIFQLILIFITGFAPIIVSSKIYDRQVRDGTWKDETDSLSGSGSMQMSRPLKILTGSVIGAVILLVILVVLFGGLYSISADQNRLQIKALLVSDLSVPLEDIESISLQKAEDPGIRTLGYNAFGIDLGNYKNDEYGSYLRYTGKSPIVIELKEDNQTVVLSENSEQETESLFEEIRSLIENQNLPAEIHDLK